MMRSTMFAATLALLGGLALSPAVHAQEMGVGQQGLINQGEQLNVPSAQTSETNLVGGGAAQVVYQGSRETVIRHFDESFTERAPGTPVDTGGRTGDVIYLQPQDVGNGMLVTTRESTADSITK